MTALRTGSMCITLVMNMVMASGCNGVFWGNLGVLCVTIGIFLGTVFLSRSSTSRSASRSSASTSRNS
ncbi:MAG: hypothetical protein JWN48_3048 [Myxococcaceae bacterium]|nr:hypothetical protein [Myxococcaceae bacterium]